MIDRRIKKTVCHYCNKEFQYKHEYCPFCFKWNVKLKEDKIMKKFIIIISGIISGIIIIYLSYSIIGSFKQNRLERLEQLEIAKLENDKIIRIESENKDLNKVKAFLSSVSPR